MRKPLLIRLARVWVLTLMCLLSAQVFAQEQPGTPPKCPLPPLYNAFITGDFEPQCLVPIEKRGYLNEYPYEMVACQGSTVVYTANIEGYATGIEWNVLGAESYLVSNDGQNITVTWGDGDAGQLTLTATNNGGWAYMGLPMITRVENVRLIEKPQISVRSVPQMDNNNVIFVCQGSSVEFTDETAATNSDIVGYYWEGCGRTGSTPNFKVEDVQQPCDVTHRVYNNCGCYDEEVYHIEVLGGEPLVIDCYGTACEGSRVTYKAVSPGDCDKWIWYVEGGSLVDGQYTSTITVDWDNVQNGYGVIGIDGVICGGATCPSMMTKKIPIIEKDLPIEGQSTVCLGEAVIYKLPLFGSTEYNWRIWPNTGFTMTPVNNANEQLVIFHQPGTYHISADYYCDFLGCGRFYAQSLTVTVKPRLNISGNNRICISNACDLTTDADPAVAVNWSVVDIENNNQVIHTYNGIDLSWNFPHEGKYKILAEHPNFCRPAEFFLTVVGAPVAPTVSDLDPNNPTKACLNSGVLMKAHSNYSYNHPDYTLVWHPVCSDNYITSNSATIQYGNTVCDVEVYNYDNVMGCRSANAYVHHVSEIVPQPVNITSPIVVCPGTELDWTNGVVPNQTNEGFTYLWKIENNKQQYVSVQGNATQSGVKLAVNDFPNPNPTQVMSVSTNVTLERRYCNTSAQTTINIITKKGGLYKYPIISPANANACVGEPITFSGTGGKPASYLWKSDDHRNYYHGTTYTHAFNTPGTHTVTLRSMPAMYDVCTNLDYYMTTTTQVHVNPLPPFYSLSYNNGGGVTRPRVVVDGASSSTTGYTFLWTYNGTVQTGSTYSTAYRGIGTYTCTITNSETGCSKTLSITLPIPVDPCTSVAWAATSYDPCTATLHLESQFTGFLYPIWTVQGGQYTITYSNDGRSADITFKEAKQYTITASLRESGDCQKSVYIQNVTFVPDFTFEKNCTSIIIHNNSKYQDADANVRMRVSNFAPGSNIGTISFINFAAGSESYTYNTGAGGTFTFTLLQPVATCPLGTVTITNQPTDVLSVEAIDRTGTPWIACDNLPIGFTASLSSGYQISETKWEFSDGTFYNKEGDQFQHTFKSQSNNYTVTATVKEENGCNVNGTTTVRAYSNNLLPGNLSESPTGKLCPGDIKRLTYVPTTTQYNPVYTWNVNNNTPTSDSYVEITNTTDVMVSVTNDHYCIAQARKNVVYKNRPVAVIRTDRIRYCVYDNVVLHGAPGPDSNTCQYNWTVLDPDGIQVSVSNQATVNFTALKNGTYTVDLTVSNNEGCSATAQTVYIEVNARPIQPTIDYAGNPCLDTPPVVLGRITPAGIDLHWSNGNYGTTAQIFTPGVVTAWYYDAYTGCKSPEASFTVDAQPDFDAMLTGCYEKCPDYFNHDPHLPVWALTRWGQTIDWKWFLEGGEIDNSSDNHTYAPILLPLKDFGTYNLDVWYNNDLCNVISPNLVINGKPDCDCEKVEISLKGGSYMKGCHIFYDYSVTVCNNSDMTYCFKDLVPLFDNTSLTMISTSFNGLSLAPGDCETFNIHFEASQFTPSQVALFSLINYCDMDCTKEFSIELMPEWFDCEQQINMFAIEPDPSFSNPAAAYYDFHLNAPGQTLLAFWSEPSMIVDYNYDGTMVIGLGMIEASTLSQMIDEEKEICFYAIVCDNDKICKFKLCVPAKMVLSGGYQNMAPAREWDENPRTDFVSVKPVISNPQLSPNPTTGEVNVIGTTDEVVEVVVMDMNGRKMATFESSPNFDISNLASGIYIVRVKTKVDDDTPEEITYLKLVKK